MSVIKAEVTLRWQDEWESESSAGHYQRDQSSVGGKRITSKGLNRHEVVITRLRLGHTGLNSTLAIIGKSDSVCSECKVVEDVNHVLFKCKKFDLHRQKWKELDEVNYIHNILQEQGMEEQRSRYLVMYLKDTKQIRRIKKKIQFSYLLFIFSLFISTLLHTPV